VASRRRDPSPELAAQLAKASRAVQRADDRARDARAKLGKLVAAAADEGASVRGIAVVTGLSVGRVHELLNVPRSDIDSRRR
jgi:hypothetical protein